MKKHPSKDGFTLIEALVGVFILTVSMAGSMSLMSAMLRANAFSTHMTTGLTLAQSVVDDLAGEDYTTVVSGNDSTSIYQRSWVVTPGASIKTIDVTVSWRSIDNRTRSCTLTTILDDRD